MSGGPGVRASSRPTVGQLARGQLRMLRPHPLFGGQERMVLLVSGPQDGDLPDDISSLPGPCRTLQAVPAYRGSSRASVLDLLVPAPVSGLGVPVTVMLDALTTVRLDPGSGPDRLGPVVGRVLPDAAVALVRAVPLGSRSSLEKAVKALEARGEGWSTGSRPVEPDSLLWTHRVREVENLRLLCAWF